MDPFILLFIGMTIVIAGIVWLRLNAFVALFAGGLVVAILTPAENIERHALSQGMAPAAAQARSQEALGPRLAAKFGTTATQLGILIAMASIIGACLMASGGAERIVRAALGVFGEARAPLVFGVSGFVLGIPIFFDTVFLLLIPIARAMATRTGKNYFLYVMCIAAGTTMTHSLVPPTPGPLFVANALNVDIGQMMVGGLLLGICTTAVGIGYAWWANLRWPRAVPPATGDAATTGDFSERPESELPPLWLALLPIVVPIVLITGLTVSRVYYPGTPAAALLAQIGHPNIALTLAAAISLATLAWKRTGGITGTKSLIQNALADAGTIILVTCAGGIFGGVLQETGIGPRIQGLAETYRLAVIPLAFFVTALVRVAQGSATVAMVTSVGILSGFGDATTLGFSPLYLALVIGCGSKLIPWMNDSGFWIVCKMSGLKETDTLRGFSVMLALMGLSGFVFVMIAAALFPLV